MDYFGPTPVGEITRDDVRGFAAALERKGLAPKSRANALGALHSLIEFALDEEWMIGEKPVKRVQKPSLAETDPDVRFLDTEEVEALLRAVPADPLGRVERVMYLTAAMRGFVKASCSRCAGATSTGPRVASGCAATTSVASSARRSPSARRAASRSPAPSPPSSSSSSRTRLVRATTISSSRTRQPAPPIDRSTLLKRFNAALRAAEVREVRFHDPRHTFGTRMAAQGVPMLVLQELMGHRDFKTTLLIYSDCAPSEREAEWVEQAFRPAAPDVSRG